ncbi:hypothetical protein [Lysobacter enzymogenes]|uniref:hypothetical protein n=1 Tax=Lysobacter enzymogenes TaxID=69 RepID=UPI00099B9108|nr:hypothetical protein [Lysobacter enzymogenes]UZW62758.1 hypothetical protein BV903_010890 [Lysobacter enzymogenes]
MSEAAFKRDSDAAFFADWSKEVGGIATTYVSLSGVERPVDVLVDTGSDQFGDDQAPVSSYSVHVIFRRAQVEPEQLGTVIVDGIPYVLVQRLEQSHGGILTDESLSVWGVQA